MELNINSNANHLDIEIKLIYTTLSVNKKDNFKSTDCVPLLVLDYKSIDSSEIKDQYITIPTPDSVESKLNYDPEGLPDGTEALSYHYDKIIDKDGWFTVYGLIIPTKEWYLNNKLLADNSYTYIIYTEDNKYYKIVAGEEKEITNIEDLLLPSYSNSTITRIELDLISIWFLQNCYINLCKQIFESRGFSKCWNKNTVDSELVYKRDLVWMAINVIKYLTELELLFEVLRIIQNINGCNGLCSLLNSTKYSSGCGCSR